MILHELRFTAARRYLARIDERIAAASAGAAGGGGHAHGGRFHEAAKRRMLDRMGR